MALVRTGHESCLSKSGVEDGEEVVECGGGAEEGGVVLNGDVAEGGRSAVSGGVGVDCFVVEEVECDREDSCDEGASLDASLLGSEGESGGGCVVDELWVGAVKEGEDGGEGRKVHGNDVEHRLPVERVVSVLLVEDEEGGKLGGAVERGEGGGEACADGVDGGVDAALGEAELVRSNHVADGVELRVDGEASGDAGVKGAHADGAGGTVGLGRCDEEGGAEEACACVCDCTFDDGVDERGVGGEERVF